MVSFSRISADHITDIWLTDQEGFSLDPSKAYDPDEPIYVSFSIVGDTDYRYFYNTTNNKLYRRTSSYFSVSSTPHVYGWDWRRIELKSRHLKRLYRILCKKGLGLFDKSFGESFLGDFYRFAMPLIRKTYPRLIANQLVSVQPMTQPFSLVFYKTHNYGSRT